NGKGDKGRNGWCLRTRTRRRSAVRKSASSEQVRKEVALPEYELFGDYSEMATQFGYIALWSTIWLLAP
ncbi:hypothetical protein B0H12DRAFT_1162410, partial [Mycena haematopus]